ncbi:Hypothetical predicted protein [Olea europaea subsp. europaea]|uniref:Uncharacterized protein n=1 Tax=Olea europaea subsp. europaea TaxID=158383 RepID=A0A8S0SSA6_OLEEU|nr:Hypothetical predicted protein [Olea europaea subsp. europaea]
MVSFSNSFTPLDQTLGSCRNYVVACVLCLGQSIDTPRGFVPTHALHPTSLGLTMVSIRDNFKPTNRTLGSWEHYIVMCVLCLGKSIDTSRDFSSPRAAGGSPVDVSLEKHHRRTKNLLEPACVGP